MRVVVEGPQGTRLQTAALLINLSLIIKSKDHGDVKGCFVGKTY